MILAWLTRSTPVITWLLSREGNECDVIFVIKCPDRCPFYLSVYVLVLEEVIADFCWYCAVVVVVVVWRWCLWIIGNSTNFCNFHLMYWIASLQRNKKPNFIRNSFFLKTHKNEVQPLILYTRFKLIWKSKSCLKDPLISHHLWLLTSCEDFRFTFKFNQRLFKFYERSRLYNKLKQSEDSQITFKKIN